MKKAFTFLTIATALLLGACAEQPQGHKTVLCVPVYGQSLALGETAQLITDFDSLKGQYDGRIVTENLDYTFGYFDGDETKQTVKKLMHYQKRTFELSIYGMAERLASQLGDDTLLCTFPGGQGATPIIPLSKGTPPNKRFLADIRKACQKAHDRGWSFAVPAICWMQGESDVFDYTGVDYKKALRQFCIDINHDVLPVTQQEDSIRIICYQTNLVSSGSHFNPLALDCTEAHVPQAMMELVRDDSLFWASGPTYPYSFAPDQKHIDGISQKRHGHLAALAALGIIRHEERRQGVVPLSATCQGHDVKIAFNVPQPPLQIDTTNVAPIANYGFSVITPDGRDIAQAVSVDSTVVTIHCHEPVTDSCHIGYAINGEPGQSGWQHGPRGNLRDSQGHLHHAVIKGQPYPLHNWCYQFQAAISSL